MDPTAMAATGYDGVILAGGGARRLGGTNKPAVRIGNRRLLDVAVEALRGARSTIVVGPPQPTTRPVRWAHESPPGGGPVAALAAGLAVTASPLVVLLAADLPFVTRRVVDDLVTQLGGARAVVAVDPSGRDQPLLGCYDVAALRSVMPAKPQGTSVRAVIGALESEVRRVSLAGEPSPTFDCDTASDVSRARELA
jgi:molybdopterin-guanine dinucleotide biosynthesis protein A